MRMANRFGMRLIVGLFVGLAGGGARANNLRITNVTVSARDTKTADVKFDISWENSWRYESGGDPLYFHDAAWVFFKVFPEGGSTWQHVTLEGTGTNPPGYAVGSGTGIEMVVPSDRVGMIVRRSAAASGAGTTSVQNITAVWNFTSNSLSPSDRVKLQAFSVEMAYVAEGAFKVGSGGTESGMLYEGGGGTNPFQITNAGPIQCNNSAGCLWGASQSLNNSMGGVGTLSTNFPNGYAAFYCMKHEITQGQYADFLNALTRGQQTARCTATTLNYYMSATAGGNAAVTNRNTVRFTGEPGDPHPRVYTTATPDRACNWLSWADVAAFADWAGLRPMTELEFEKACRGPLNPAQDEYAWGTATIMADASRVLSGAEDGTETVTNSTALGGCNYGDKAHTGGDAGSGPLRVGIFATNGASRVSAGASYWGIMELSGNLWERTVTIGTTQGRSFTGLHGNGVLTSGDGDADVSNWPPISTDGTGFRGGTWSSAATEVRASDRAYAAGTGVPRHQTRGGRAVRSAP